MKLKKYKIATPKVHVETKPGHSLISVFVNGNELCRLIVATPLCDTREADWECNASLEWRSPKVQAVYMESTSKAYGDKRDYDEEVNLIRGRRSCDNAYPHLHLSLVDGPKQLVTTPHKLHETVDD